MPCVGIFLKIEYCEGMLSYSELNMCCTYRNTVNVVLWYHHWLSNKIISSDLEYVCDIVLLKFWKRTEGNPRAGYVGSAGTWDILWAIFAVSFFKIISIRNGDYRFFSLISSSMFVLNFSIFLFILASLLYPTIFLYYIFFVLFSPFPCFFDKRFPWDVGIYHFVSSKCCFGIV